MSKIRRAQVAHLPGVEGTDVIAFELGSEHYALPLQAVQEIVRTPPLTWVPRAPRAVLGIAGVRGQIVTVVDLGPTLGHHDRGESRQERLLLLRHRTGSFGLMVDRVLQVYRLNVDEIEPAHEIGGALSEYILGVGRPADKPELLILLDPRIISRALLSAEARG